VKFPTGGDSPRGKILIRWNSEADGQSPDGRRDKKGPEMGFELFMISNLDYYFIRDTFNLARKGEGIVSPNPLVGAIVVKDGKVLGKGYHKGRRKPHAEVCAIEDAGSKVRGGTLYISLEPCCHYGETPPCTDLIISSGIKRVVAPIEDPNPLVNGKGFEVLRSNKVEVTTGVLKEEACQLNSFYLKYIKEKIPYVVLKAALTLDGRIGDPRREIYEITSRESREEVHRWRNRVDAILVGVETVITDDPELTIRLVRASHEPYKIVIDPNLRTPKDAKIFDGKGNVIIVAQKEEGNNRYPDADVWTFQQKKGIIPVKEILKRAGEFGITSILIEGGSRTYTNFVTEGVVDKYLLFYSPSIIGDGLPFLSCAVRRKFLNTHIKTFGDDILVEANNSCLQG